PERDALENAARASPGEEPDPDRRQDQGGRGRDRLHGPRLGLLPRERKLEESRPQPAQPRQPPPCLPLHPRPLPLQTRTSAAATRSAACPSQSSGTRPGLARPARTSVAAATALAGSVPTSWLVPTSTVTGRSVFSRSVRQGTPSAVVSSWMPPESVI